MTVGLRISLRRHAPLFVSRARCGVQRRFAEPGPIRSAKRMGSRFCSASIRPAHAAPRPEHEAAFPRHVRARVLHVSLPPKVRGRRECRVLSRTRGPVCELKKAYERSHHRSPSVSGIPCTNGFNGFLRALPGDRAFLSPSPAAMRMHRCQLDIGVEMSGPHGFAVRDTRTRQLRYPRPSHPAPTFVTIGQTPLV